MHKKIRSLVSVLILISILAACASPAAPTEAPAEPQSAATQAPAEQAMPTDTMVPAPTEPPAAMEEPTKEPVTIKILDFAQENVDFYKQAAEQFQMEYPWITLQWDTMVQDDYNASLPLMFKSDLAPDIFIYYAQRGTYFELSELLEYGWVQPLDETALDPNFKDRFPGTFGMMDPIYSRDGQMYGIPFDPQTGPLGHGYMWYNKDVLSNAGVEVPKTWNELLEACRAIRQSGPYCLSISLNTPSQAVRTLLPLLAVNGADPDFHDPQTGLFTYTSPAVAETVQFLRKFYEEDLVLPGVNEKGFVRAAVANGEAAFYFDGGWMASVFQSSYDYSDPGVAVPPAPDEAGYKGKIRRGPDEPAYFVSSQSQHPYEASLFINWMTRPDGWFTTQYLSQTSYILPWADNENLTKSELTKEMVNLSPQIRDWGPVPALKCQDLANSQAVAEANALHPDWEWEAIAEYLLNGGDWMAIGKEIEDAKNNIFTETLDEEAASGLNISAECYAVPGWDPLTPFDYSTYQN